MLGQYNQHDVRVGRQLSSTLTGDAMLSPGAHATQFTTHTSGTNATVTISPSDPVGHFGDEFTWIYHNDSGADQTFSFSADFRLARVNYTVRDGRCAVFKFAYEDDQEFGTEQWALVAPPQGDGLDHRNARKSMATVVTTPASIPMLESELVEINSSVAGDVELRLEDPDLSLAGKTVTIMLTNTDGSSRAFNFRDESGGTYVLMPPYRTGAGISPIPYCMTAARQITLSATSGRVVLLAVCVYDSILTRYSWAINVHQDENK